MNNTAFKLPLWLNLFLAPIIISVIYTVVAHAMPLAEVIIVIASALTYAGVATYLMVKANQKRLIIRLWLTVLMSIFFIISWYFS